MHHYELHLIREGAGEPEVLSIMVARESRARELALELLSRAPGGLTARAWRGGLLAFELDAASADEG